MKKTDGSTTTEAAFQQDEEITINAFAEQFKLDRRTVKRRALASNCVPVRTHGRISFFRKAELTAAMELGRRPCEQDPGRISQAQARASHILLQNQVLEHRLSVFRKEFVPADNVRVWAAELGAAIRKVVTQIHLVAPSVVSLSVIEAEGRLKELEDEIISQLHGIGGETLEPVPLGAAPKTDEPRAC